MAITCSKFSTMVLDNKRFFYLALLLAITPLWIADFLPGVDLPGQAAQASALREIWLDNPVFTEFFEINLWTPYLTGTALLALLSFMMPVGIALKLITSIVVVATPIIAGRLFDEIGGDSRWRWLIIPSTYSFAFYWGFFPFFSIVPLGLLLLLFTIRLHRQPTLGLAALIAAYSVFLFFSHLLVLCFSSLLALAWLAGSNFRTPARLARLSIPYATTLPLIAAWLFTTLDSGSYVSTESMSFGPLLKRPLDIIVQSSGLDGSFFAVSVFIFLVIVALPLVSRMALTRKPEKWALALCGFAVFMVFPSYGMGTAFLYERFGLYLPILWFVLWERTPSDTPRWHWLGMVAVFLFIGTNVLRFSTFNLETRGFATVMAEMEPEKRALSMMIVNGSSQFTSPVFLHVPSWYQAERRGIVDYNFGMFYGTMVRYQTGKQSAIDDDFGWSPQRFDWRTHGGDTFDYFVIRSPADVSEDIFKDRRSSVELIRNENVWWLYKNIGADR
jgi:hypothetical protein